MSASTKRALLIIAAVLLAAAAAWRVILEVKSPLREICARVNSFGYSVSPGDFTLERYGSSQTIESLFIGRLTDDEIGAMAEASRACGFPADLEKVGSIELLLMDMGGGSVMLIYTLDGAPELAFIEDVSSGGVRPIG